jgi:hypothetical protein
MTALTKFDVAAIRHADALSVHLSSRNPEGLVRAVKRHQRTEKDPYAQDVAHTIDAAVVLDTMRGQEELKNGQAQFFASVGLYHSQHCHASAVLRTLRAGDDISFRFYPDGHTNQYIAAAGLHGDLLKLQVRRNGKLIADWELTTSICPNNSARMCRGVPNSEHYARDAENARRAA